MAQHQQQAGAPQPPHQLGVHPPQPAPQQPLLLAHNPLPAHHPHPMHPLGPAAVLHHHNIPPLPIEPGLRSTPQGLLTQFIVFFCKVYICKILAPSDCVFLVWLVCTTFWTLCLREQLKFLPLTKDILNSTLFLQFVQLLSYIPWERMTGLKFTVNFPPVPQYLSELGGHDRLVILLNNWFGVAH
ncbi:hypothetical protein C8Q75DRAFT_806491 [Abortiporus biennis]|nr:hypothetical protein C8Q75DRAFT_806491 [Abortiporus biennis]